MQELENNEHIKQYHQGKKYEPVLENKHGDRNIANRFKESKLKHILNRNSYIRVNTFLSLEDEMTLGYKNKPNRKRVPLLTRNNKMNKTIKLDLYKATSYLGKENPQRKV